jgi:hypothetical protein
MRQPWPSIFSPPMMYSIGMKTFSPQFGPFGKAAPDGK